MSSKGIQAQLPVLMVRPGRYDDPAVSFGTGTRLSIPDHIVPFHYGGAGCKWGP